MNAQTPQVKKPVTPDKVANLLASVFSKFLILERRDEFYESLRKWDRGENPFVNFTRICTNNPVPDEDKYVALLRLVEDLERTEFNIQPEFMKVLEDITRYSQRPIYLSSVQGDYDVITVRTTDILRTREQRETFTYEQFLELAAEDCDLYPCSLYDGLRALLYLSLNNRFGSYFIGLPVALITEPSGPPLIPYAEIGIECRGSGSGVEPVYRVLCNQVVDCKKTHSSPVDTLAFGTVIPPHQKRVIMVKMK